MFRKSQYCKLYINPQINLQNLSMKLQFELNYPCLSKGRNGWWIFSFRKRRKQCDTYKAGLKEATGASLEEEDHS